MLNIMVMGEYLQVKAKHCMGHVLAEHACRCIFWRLYLGKSREDMIMLSL